MCILPKSFLSAPSSALSLTGLKSRVLRPGRLNIMSLASVDRQMRFVLPSPNMLGGATP